MKKLVIINGAQFGYSAGHYHYCKYLKDRLEIDYICFDRGLKRIELEGVNVHYLKFKNVFLERHISFIYNSRLICKTIKPDTLFIVYSSYSVLLRLLCAYKKNSILDIRTGSLSPKLFLRSIQNQIIKFQSLFFTKRIVLSQSLKKLLHLKDHNTFIVPLGADIIHEGNCDFTDIHLLYVGAFNNRRIEDTIKGCSMFLKSHKDFENRFTYTIIGKGDQQSENKIKALINECSLGDKIKMIGYVNYVDIGEYYHKSNLGISYVPITDFYNVQPPTKTFEYILNGLFTIATATTENKYLINESNGVLCDDNAESFAKALDDYINLKEKVNSEKIRKTLINFEWKSIVINKLLPLIKDESINSL